jgi:hypothetical protein
LKRRKKIRRKAYLHRSPILLLILPSIVLLHKPPFNAATPSTIHSRANLFFITHKQTRLLTHAFVETVIVAVIEQFLPLACKKLTAIENKKAKP